MTKIYKLDYESPIGIMEIVGTNEIITSILFSENVKKVNCLYDETPSVLKECFNQLEEYFKGNRRNFSFSYQVDGTEFQNNVWEALIEISYAKQCFIRILRFPLVMKRPSEQ